MIGEVARLWTCATERNTTSSERKHDEFSAFKEPTLSVTEFNTSSVGVERQ